MFNALPETAVFQIVYDSLDALFDKAAAPQADSYSEVLGCSTNGCNTSPHSHLTFIYFCTALDCRVSRLVRVAAKRH